jgi:hypothetical protein
MRTINRIMKRHGHASVIVLVIAVSLLSYSVNSAHAQESMPSMSLLPASGTAGTEVLIAAEGFPPGANIMIRFGDKIVATMPGEVVVGLNGTFAVVIVIPPDVTGGEHVISARDESGNVATSTFTVITATISISPTVGMIGTKVNVTGSSFLPERGITVNMNGSLVSTGETSADGTFETAFVIPSAAGLGLHIISVSDGINKVTITLLVIGDVELGSFNISKPQLVDQTGNEVSAPMAGMQLLVRSEIENSESADQEFTYIVQIKDSEGATVMISWMEGTISAQKQYRVAQSWLVTDAGEYTAEVFVWKSITEPVVLAPMQTITFNVATNT